MTRMENGENQRLVTDELAEYEKQLVGNPRLQQESYRSFETNLRNTSSINEENLADHNM